MMLINLGKKILRRSSFTSSDWWTADRTSFFFLNLLGVCDTMSPIEKVFKRRYLTFQLVRMGIPHSESTSIYCAIICSVLEYAWAVCHRGLITAQSRDTERNFKNAACIYCILALVIMMFYWNLDQSVLVNDQKKFIETWTATFNNPIMYYIIYFRQDPITNSTLETVIYMHYLQPQQNFTSIFSSLTAFANEFSIFSWSN